MLITFNKRELVNASKGLGSDLADLMSSAVVTVEILDDDKDELMLNSDTEFNEYLCSQKEDKNAKGTIFDTIKGQEFDCDICSMKEKGICR